MIARRRLTPESKIMSDPNAAQDVTTKTVDSKWFNPILRYVMEAVAICFWIYVICKLFIFDIDVYVIQKNQS